MTLKWLDLCVRTKELVAIRREMPLLRPLPWPLPLRGFTGLVVAVSQYHMEQRELLRELITLLGGCGVRGAPPRGEGVDIMRDAWVGAERFRRAAR